MRYHLWSGKKYRGKGWTPRQDKGLPGVPTKAWAGDGLFQGGSDCFQENPRVAPLVLIHTGAAYKNTLVKVEQNYREKGGGVGLVTG